MSPSHKRTLGTITFGDYVAEVRIVRIPISRGDDKYSGEDINN